MTVQFGTQVYIGCVDIAGCGATIVNSLDAPAAPLELACLANAPAVLGVAGSASEPALHACSVKHIPTADGQMARAGGLAGLPFRAVQVTFVAVNVEPTAGAPAAAIAHELVGVLRDSAVEFVGVLGAAHLPAAAGGELLSCSPWPHTPPCSDGGDEGGVLPAAAPELIKGASPLPEGTELKDEMLAALYFWLQAAGIPSALCLVRGHRAAGAGAARPVDPAAFGGLARLPEAVAGVALNEGQLRGAKLLSAAPARVAVVDSLMYM